MRELVAYYVLGKKGRQKTSTKSIFSIPPVNKENKATKSKGRESALKDTIGNAFAAGQELKAMMLKVFDAVGEGGNIGEEQLVKMAADIGTTTPYCMANVTGGAKHANKAAGPLKWLQSECSDGFQDDQFYEATAHAVDLPVTMHQGVSPEAFEGGTCGVIRYFLDEEVYGKWLRPPVELLVVAYDRAENVPCVKGFEQGARMEKMGECDRAFKPLCMEPIPGSKSAWPADNFDGWVPRDDDKVHLFVLVYLLAGCDFHPAIAGMPFEKMWATALQSMREPGVFSTPLFAEQDGIWVLDDVEAVKLLATMFYFKHEAALRSGWRSPAEILRAVDGDVAKYVAEIRFVIWTKGDKKATATCPSFSSNSLQVARGGSVMVYWQGGLEKKMPPQEWKGKGWGLNPKGSYSEGEKLTTDNCVLWLSEYSYIGPDRKTVTLTCGCSPDKAVTHRCRSCGCKGRSCSLMCGCRGSCRLEPTPLGMMSPEVCGATEEERAPGGVSSVGGYDGEGEEDLEIDVEAGSDDGIPEWNRSDEESCGSDDDFFDLLVEGGDVEGGISDLVDAAGL